MYMHVSCCVFLCTHACYNVLVFQKNRVLLEFSKKRGFLKKLGSFEKNLGCPGIFREIKGNTHKCPGRPTSQGVMSGICGDEQDRIKTTMRRGITKRGFQKRD